MIFERQKILLFYIVSVLFLTGCILTKEEKTDNLFRPYSGPNSPGAAVLIIEDGEPLFAKTYGQANLEQKLPVTAKTNFRLASVTKQFTATCVMMLVEQGKLSYHTTLTDIFSEFPAYGKQITIKNILQHTSGLIAYEDLVPDTVSVQVLDKDIFRLMTEQDSTYFKPGSQYRYSNTGYAILVQIIEKVSGVSFAEFLEEQIFEPLEMRGSVAYQKGISEVPHRALGYAVTDSGIFDSDQSAYSAVLGDGGIYSSLDDLLKWDQALYTTKLVSDSTLQKAFTPFKERYGFGWRIDEYRGHRRLHHTGSTSGFRNVIQRFPDDRFTVIILTNRKEPGVAPLAEKLVDWYLLDEQ